MSMNLVQFQKGLSLIEFLEHYGTEAKCKAELEARRWPKGFVCPECGHSEHCVVYHNGCKTFQCTHCRTQTTLTSGTIFQNTRLPLFKWFYAMYLMTQSKNNVSALELTRVLGVCYRSAWRLKHKLTQVMYERENKRVLKGRIEIDDAYLGGEHRGGKAGRGSENKVPFIAAVQTTESGGPQYAVYTKVATFSGEQIETWAKEKLQEGSIVISDGLKCFASVTQAGCIHKPVVVGQGQRSTDLPCFTWVNTVLGNLKTAFSGTFHTFKAMKYAHRYLAETQYRFNRRFDMKAMLPRMLMACVQTSARPETWLRSAET